MCSGERGMKVIERDFICDVRDREAHRQVPAVCPPKQVFGTHTDVE